MSNELKHEEEYPMNQNSVSSAFGSDDIVTAHFQVGAPAGDELSREILVVLFGDVQSTNGAFVVDEESMRATIEAFTTHGTDLPIDFEHQTLGGSFSAPSG